MKAIKIVNQEQLEQKAIDSMIGMNMEVFPNAKCTWQSPVHCNTTATSKDTGESF